jgi:hypothetical protein
MGHISGTWELLLCEYWRKSMIIGEKNTTDRGTKTLLFDRNWAISLKPRRRSRPLRLVWWALQVHIAWAGFEVTTLVVIGTECISTINPTTIWSRPRQPWLLRSGFLCNRVFCIGWLSKCSNNPWPYKYFCNIVNTYRYTYMYSPSDKPTQSNLLVRGVQICSIFYLKINE